MGLFNQGAAPMGILDRALTGNIYVEQSLAYMNEGDKDGYNVLKWDIQNVLEAYSDNPTFADGHQKANYKRALVKVQSKEKFNPASYEQFWRSYQPDGLFIWQELPTEVQSTMENLFLGSSVEATEDALTNGSSTIVGLIPQYLSQDYTVLNGTSPTSTQIVENTTIAFRANAGGTGDNLGVALTTANIFDKIEILIRNQTTAMRKRKNRRFMINNATADIIGEAQRLNLNYKGVDVTEEGILRYAGYEFVQNTSFPDNTILFCSMSGDMKTDAYQLGTSTTADFNNLHVARISQFSAEYGMLLTFALDIFVVRPEESCFYSDQATIA
tara:strand:- start:2862 stop:3845 length:984 start_codon:yes stop_codon:yes gene_type:complete